MGIRELQITISKEKKRFGEKSRIQKNFVFQIEVKNSDTIKIQIQKNFSFNLKNKYIIQRKISNCKKIRIRKKYQILKIREKFKFM